MCSRRRATPANHAGEGHQPSADIERHHLAEDDAAHHTVTAQVERKDHVDDEEYPQDRTLVLEWDHSQHQEHDEPEDKVERERAKHQPLLVREVLHPVGHK